MTYQNSLQFAKSRDDRDPLNKYRDQFYFPKSDSGESQLYLCGNSLGLQCKSVENEIQDVLSHWKLKGVEGHFEGDNSWIEYNEKLKPSFAKIVGAKTNEIAIMNTLTVNLHHLLLSFYTPTKKRYKILIEQDAFPSDKYVVDSQAKFHGLDPTATIIYAKPKDGNILLEEDDIMDVLEAQGEEIALVLLGGINYYTGQLLPIQSITEKAQAQGCIVGFDLAHVVGNVPLTLHDDKVDFAAWCNYKYINGGPGAIGSIFIHEKHHKADLPRLEGWWGNKLENRFLMQDGFDPEVGAEAWVMSTPPTLAIAPIKASLSLFDEIGMDALRKKSMGLTGFLEYLIDDIKSNDISIITPSDPAQRGSQLSIAIKNADKSLYNQLIANNVILDWREPNVIRVSPAAMYNSYEDVFSFVQILKQLLKQS